MAYTEANKNYFDFNKGIITETSPLNRPEGTSIDERNFELFAVEGYRKRRKGLNVETTTTHGHNVNTGLGRGTLATFDSYRWDNPGNVTDTSFVVVKDGSILRFWQEVAGEFTVPTALANVFNILDLYDYRADASTSRANIDDAHVSYSSGMGFLFVNCELTDALMITWDTTDGMIVRKVTPWERDLDGLDDGLIGNARPVSLTQNHAYNLWNQGWPANQITTYFTANGVYPSNAQIWHYGKLITPSTGREGFDVQHLDAQDFGNAPAPKGRIVKHMYDHDENFITYHVASPAGATIAWNNATKLWTVTTVDPHGLAASNLIMIVNGNLKTNTSGYAPEYDLTGGWFVNTVPSATTFTLSDPTWASSETAWRMLDDLNIILPGSVAGTLPPYWDSNNTKRYGKNTFFANRLWIGGMDDERYGKRVYFSQIGTTPEKLTKFYQESDPTSEHIADLYPTDGGFVSIPDMGRLLRMETFGKFLILFADNGIWAVGPGDAKEFRADDYSVVEIARLDLVESEAIVKTGSDIIFWASEGMFIITMDQVNAEPSIQNISKTTVQTLYQNVLKNNVMPIKGSFDNVNNRVFWLYNDTTATDWNAAHQYSWQANRILILDLTIGAWYKYDLPTNDSSKLFQPVAMQMPKEFTTRYASVKLMVMGDSSLGTDRMLWHTFSNDTNFRDLDDYILNGGTASHPIPVLDTSYELMGDAMRNKFANYVFCYFNRTEDTAVANGGGYDLTTESGCLLSVRWDWTDNTISGKYGTARQVYRLGRYLPPGAAGDWENGFPVVVTKNKVRGTGRSLHLHFEGEEDKDVQLLGWAINLQGVTKP